jgi:hypothetical protein
VIAILPVFTAPLAAITLGKFSPELDLPGNVAALKKDPHDIIGVGLRGTLSAWIRVTQCQLGDKL